MFITISTLFSIFYCVFFGFFFKSPYAQLLAATTLTKLVSRPNLTLPLEQRIDIRKYATDNSNGGGYQM